MLLFLALCLALATPFHALEDEPVAELRISYEGSKLLKVTAPSEDKREALKKLESTDGKYISIHPLVFLNQISKI